MNRSVWHRPGTAITLALALAASQAALLVLTPVLPEVAGDLGVSTATAGQLRSISGLTAGVAAVASGLVATRIGLRDLLCVGLGLLIIGAAVSAAAPTFEVLAVAQVVVGAGVGVTYTAGIAAVAEWSTEGQRSRVLSLALLGPPLAWVVGMPVAGFSAEMTWRLAWILVPLTASAVAVVFVAARCPTQPAAVRADLRSVLAYPGVARWSAGELLAFSAWVGTLVFIGALFVETYELSTTSVGIVLGVGAVAYMPGNLVFRQLVDEHARALLIVLALAAAAVVVMLGAIRPAVWVSLALFSLLGFLAGGRTLAGSAYGLDLAPELRLGVTGVRTAALQLGYFLGAAVGGAALSAGGYTALGVVFGLLFAAATVPHLWPHRESSTLTA